MTFIHRTIGTNLKLDLYNDQSFVFVNDGRGCEGNEFGTSTYKGNYSIENNILILKPKTIFVVKGQTVYENRVKIERIESTTLKDFDPKESYLSLKYEILDFENFKILLRLEYPSYLYDYELESDQSVFFNYLNTTKEVDKKYNSSFDNLFLTAEKKSVDISLEKMRQSETLKNRKEIFKVPFTASITSIKQRVEKNDDYSSDFDDPEFFTYLDIKIDSGTENGVYSGMYIYFKSKSTCILEEYPMFIQNTEQNTSTFTYSVYGDEECDLVNDLIGKEVYFKGHWSQ